MELQAAGLPQTEVVDSLVKLLTVLDRQLQHDVLGSGKRLGQSGSMFHMRYNHRCGWCGSLKAEMEREGAYGNRCQEKMEPGRRRLPVARNCRVTQQSAVLELVYNPGPCQPTSDAMFPSVLTTRPHPDFLRSSANFAGEVAPLWNSP